jgi:hypothetical protein
MEDVKLERVEWYDDRFYKLYIDEDFEIPETFNKNHVHLSKDERAIYFPSVTTVLGVEPKPFLNKWRGDIGNREADLRLKEAQDRGSLIHDLCARLIMGKTIIFRNEKTNFPTIDMIQGEGEIGEDVFLCYGQEVMAQITRFNRLLDILKPKIIDIEKTVYSLNEIFYAGTIDYIWELEEGDYQISTKKGEHIEAGRYIVDLKTGNSCSKDYLIQTVAYTKAYSENIKGNIIIHTNSDNKTGIEGIKLFIETDLELYWEQFKNYYRTFQFINKDIKPKLYEIPYLLKRKD